jgi:hypothetical protein
MRAFGLLLEKVPVTNMKPNCRQYKEPKSPGSPKPGLLGFKTPFLLSTRQVSNSPSTIAM